MAEGTESQVVDDITAADSDEVRHAGPFGLAVDRYQAIFMLRNMPHLDTVARYVY